ncbi:hypothetical protein HID58_017845 [Brassica napus]|uniref:Uncharacterized protein n=1 Tax=Brassica napus TaxID=3708 RepID=A0ABQ8D890_BRANA|nr:hypothetical protein HID58_017845 [Brassica napus]
MVETVVQSEHEDVGGGDIDVDTAKEAQTQIDRPDSESSPTLDTDMAVTSSPTQQKELESPTLQASSDVSLQPPADLHPLTGSPAAPLGAWAKPLAWVRKSIAQFDVPPEPVNWPALSSKPVGKQVYSNENAGNTSTNAIPPPTKAIPTDKKRFPWTARLNPKSRNLHRVTIPEYMEDATNTTISQGGSLVKTAANEDELNRCQVDSFVNSAAIEELSPVVTDLNTTVVSSSSPTIDVFSLASITELENMCNSPSIICINDTVETPTPELAQKISTASTSQKIFTGARDGACIFEPDLGSNKFASLINVEEEGEDTVESDETESMDYLTPLGKRILRERPVKPSTKAREMHFQPTSRGRGNRGRGNRGRRS